MRSTQLSRGHDSVRSTRRVRLGSSPRGAARRAPAFGVDAVLLGRYRLSSPLGVGAFASVWLAVDERLEREVAVKIIPRGRVIEARFEREAWAAARLSHPAIVTLYEAVADEGAAYLVSELVRGLTLEEALAGGHLSDQGVVAVGLAMCDALAYAHAQGIVHRDVKPSNILVPTHPPSAAAAAKLTDFGVAHAVGGDALTATGAVVGTAAYMAPEQAAGREAGPVADLYSLALVLYEGLTGINPLATVGSAHRGTRLGLHLPPLRRQRRDLPRELGRGIDLALRPRPGERGTMAELHRALEISLPALADRPGVVAGPWRMCLTRLTPEGATTDTRLNPRGATAELGSSARTPPTRLHDGPAAAGPRARWPRRNAAGGDESVRLLETFRPGARATAAATGAVLTGWLAAHALAPSPLAPAAAALAAAAIMLAFPRLGFVLVAVALSLVTAAQGYFGEALLISLAALAAVAAAPTGTPFWSLAGGAPLLSAVGLAGAWPGIAARAGTVRGRATLGLVGWIWLTLATPLAGRPLYLALLSQGAAWRTSAYLALHRVLAVIVSSGALAPALVWAAGAAVLPALVAKRSLLLDTGRIALWAVALVVCTQLAITLTRFGSTPASVHTALAGALGAALVSLTPSAAAAWERSRAQCSEARVP